MADVTFEELAERYRRVETGATPIEAEAARYTLAELAEALLMTRSRLQAIADSWTQEQLRVRPSGEGPDQWTATEVLSHLIANQNWNLMHFGRLLGRREHFDIMPHGLGDHAQPEMPQPELASNLHNATQRAVAAIESAPDDADLAATRDSTYFGDLTLRGWAYLMVIHDIQHLAQIERLRDLPTFPAD